MSTQPRSLQFGLRALFFVMTGLALVLGFIIAIGELLGIGGPAALGVVVSQQIYQLPVYVVWLWGAVQLWRRRHVHPLTTKHGLIGIGGLASVSMGSSLAILVLQARAMGGASPGSSWVIWWWGYFLLAAVANAVFWIFIIKAILRFRVTQRPTAPLVDLKTQSVPIEPAVDGPI